jgi:hypothetical protein
MHQSLGYVLVMIVLEYALVMWDGPDQDVIKVMCIYTTLIPYEARKL